MGYENCGVFGGRKPKIVDTSVTLSPGQTGTGAIEVKVPLKRRAGAQPAGRMLPVVIELEIEIEVGEARSR